MNAATLPVVLSSGGSVEQRALRVLRGCENWWDAADARPGDQVLPNRGTVGSVTDLTFGSSRGTTVRTDASGTFLDFPGVGGTFASVPDAANLRIAGDLEVVARIRHESPTAGGFVATIMARRGSGTNSWQLRTQGGNLQFIWWVAGAAKVAASTVTLASVGIGIGSNAWVKATFDADNLAGASEVKLWYGPDGPTEPTVWTQMGATLTPFTPSTIDVVAGPGVSMGDWLAGGETMTGRVYRVIIRNGINGTTVFDFTPSGDNSSTTMLAATGQTVTRNTTGVDSADPTILPFAGETYVQLPGVAGNDITTTRAASATVTTWEVAARVTLSALGVAQNFSDVNGRYAFGLDSSNRIRSWWQNSVSGVIGNGASGVVPVSVGQKIWFRSVLTTATGVADYWYSTTDTNDRNAVVWVSAGSGVPTNPGTADVTNTTAVQFGGVGTPFAGRLHAGYQIVNDSGTLRVNEFRADRIASASGTTGGAVVGNEFTINRSTSGHQTSIVTAPVVRFGGAQQLVADASAMFDIAASQNVTALLVFRYFGTQTNFGRYLKLTQAGSDRLSLYAQTTTQETIGNVGDGGAPSYTNSNTVVVSGAARLVALVRDVGADLLRLFTNGNQVSTATDTTTAALTTGGSAVFSISGTSGIPVNMEFRAAVVHRGVLTAQQLADIAAYYQRAMA